MSNINSLDLAVGIPSYNEADNIEFVVRQVAAGLEKYFPDLNTAIINADNFSQDGTKDHRKHQGQGQPPEDDHAVLEHNANIIQGYSEDIHGQATCPVSKRLRSTRTPKTMKIRPIPVKYRLGRTISQGPRVLNVLSMPY